MSKGPGIASTMSSALCNTTPSGSSTSVLSSPGNSIMSTQIIETNKNLDKDENMLPVHFLPEGRQCYDWINKDLTNRSKNPATKLNNSIKYTSANMNINNDSAKNNALHELLSAAENNQLDSLKEIINAHPLFINSTDSDGYTALHRACYSGHEEIVKYLLENGANVHARTNDGWQPIHCATRWNHVTIVVLLLQNKADINSTTNGTQTPLHFAALSEENIIMLEMLLCQPDIKMNIVNGAGDTAYDLAKRNGPQAKLFEMKEDAMNI